MKAHETRLRVRYAETDQMGVVYHANYLVWMEVGRVEYCRAAGVRYKEMEGADGIYLAVVEAHCRFVRPARYDEEVTVETWIEAATRRKLEFGYRMRRDAVELATGSTKHIFLDRTMKPARLPEKYMAAFGVKAMGQT
jgi:acyl-CoA thioester hydrolase